MALDQGYNSVHHFLQYLNGKGDFPEEDDKYLGEKDKGNTWEKTDSAVLAGKKSIHLFVFKYVTHK